MRFTLFAILLALPAWAQDIPPERQNELTMVYDNDGFGRCLVETDPRSDCIGSFRSACAELAKTEAEWFFCIESELEAWDGQLNWLYKFSLEELKKQAEQYDVPKGDDPRSMESNLREMQRAWIPYRDALCGFAGSLTAGGQTAVEENLKCQSDETARQVLKLGTMVGFF